MNGILSTYVGGNYGLFLGQSAGGGFYAGQINDNGVIYNLIVAPKSSGEMLAMWGGHGTTGIIDVINGPGNTTVLAALGASYQAANFCKGLTIGGNSDWYLPAENELEVLYYNLKPDTNANYTGSGINANAVPARTTNYTSGSPTQTSVTNFRTNGTDVFASNFYWSSTEYSAFFAWSQSFSNGVQNGFIEVISLYVRAVRRIIALSTVPAAPTIGTVTINNPSSITVAFTAPSNTGNSPIISYTVTSSTGNYSATGVTSPITVTGLSFTPVTSYTFTVTATNAVGTSAPSSPTTSVSVGIGQSVGGGAYTGIINDGGVNYYLIVAPVSGGETTSVWGTYGLTTNATSLTNGLGNTTTIITNDPAGENAAKYCRQTVVVGGYTDWYLPAKDELNLMYTNKASMPIGYLFASFYYWSSTEANASYAWFQYFNGGYQFPNGKDGSGVVRAVRRIAI